MEPSEAVPETYRDGFMVAIRIDAKPGEAAAVASILTDLIVPTMAEPGVRLFLPLRAPTEDGVFFVFEHYENRDAWHEHEKTDHFKTAVEGLLPRVSRRERVPFVPF